MPFDERLNSGSDDEPEMSYRQQITYTHCEELLFLDEDEFDEAIIGVVEGAGVPKRVVYDQDKVIDILLRTIPELDDAIDHFYFNIIGAYVGEHTPVFMSPPVLFKP